MPRRERSHGLDEIQQREPQVQEEVPGRELAYERGLRARKAGVNEKTLRRWLASDEEFRAEYMKARQATFEAGISRLHALTAQAVETLQALLGETQPGNVRLGAARTVLELGADRHDAETLVQRLDEIEALQQDLGARPGRS